MKDWMKERLNLSDVEARAHTWILQVTDGGKRPLHVTMLEVEKATDQTRTFAEEILKALAIKGCIEYQKLDIYRNSLIFAKVTEYGKPWHGEVYTKEGTVLTTSTHLDYRNDLITEEEPEEDEREILRQSIEKTDNEKAVVIEPWMMNFHLKPLALLYYAYAYSNRTSGNRWYEKINDTCEKFEVSEATLALARNALTEKGLLMREFPQRRPSASYPYIVKTETLNKKGE